MPSPGRGPDAALHPPRTRGISIRRQFGVAGAAFIDIRAAAAPAARWYYAVIAATTERAATDYDRPRYRRGASQGRAGSTTCRKRCCLPPSPNARSSGGTRLEQTLARPTASPGESNRRGRGRPTDRQRHDGDRPRAGRGQRSASLPSARPDLEGSPHRADPCRRTDSV